MYSYLENKRVALVGPAASLEGTNKGNYIDSFDVVVRLNYAKTNIIGDSGAKTDIIYYDGSHHKHNSVDYLVCAYPETEWFFNDRCLPTINKYKGLFNHRIISQEVYHTLKNDLDANNKVRPNTGLVAIVDLLKSNLKNLYITGLDFYRSSYLKSHPDYGRMQLDQVINTFNQGDNGDVHDVDIQFNYFKNKLLKDPRIEIDEFLKQFV